VEFVITSDMWTRLQTSNNITLSFDWDLDDVGLDSNEDVWIKARMYNGSEMVYLGSQTGGGNDDSYADILYQQTPSDTSGSEWMNVTEHITGTGNYYLELGARVNDWSNNEWADVSFDNLNLVVY
jgi:hypothetical protein